VLVRALELAGRTEDDLTDLEIVLRQRDELWFADFCIEELRRLPSEVEPVIGMREVMLIQARGVIKQAQRELAQVWSGNRLPFDKDFQDAS